MHCVPTVGCAIIKRSLLVGSGLFVFCFHKQCCSTLCICAGASREDELLEEHWWDQRVWTLLMINEGQLYSIHSYSFKMCKMPFSIYFSKHNFIGIHNFIDLGLLMLWVLFFFSFSHKILRFSAINSSPGFFKTVLFKMEKDLLMF